MSVIALYTDGIYTFEPGFFLAAINNLTDLLIQVNLVLPN
jgi:hypothetical protein